MFIVQLTFKVALNEVDKYLQAHRDFLDYYYKQGLLVASGPMKPRTGGIIIAAMNNRTQLEEILQKDPYYMAELADYQIIDFTPVKHCTQLQELIQKSEGKLC